jgi:SPX domain protein involved in polyphosphate accumulation
MLPRLRDELKPYMEYDEHARHLPNNAYTVRSIYFDDKNLRYFYQKEYNHAERKKIRLRGYGHLSDSKVVMEIKRKFSGAGIKNREFLDYTKAVESIKSGSRISGNSDETMFLYHIIRYSLFPTVNVVYDREAFMTHLESKNNLRVTMDMNLRYLSMPNLDQLFNQRDLKQVHISKFILEVKFNDFYPQWLQDSVSRLGLKRSPASKYSICIRHSHPWRTGMMRYLRHKPLRDY